LTTQIQLGAISSSAISSLQGPRITTVYVTDSSYNNLDDTAVDSAAGGYIKIIGTGFVSGCIVAVGSQAATSTTFISSTEVRAQLAAQSSGSYTLYLSNPDGSLAIRALGINFSGFPTWTTAASQTITNSVVNFQFTATSDSTVTYTVNTGSTLPPNLNLASNGLLSGTATGNSGTVYTFTLQATDVENQNTPRTFTVTLSFGDPQFSNTYLLIHADGSSGANNNTIIDSSNNNFTVTKTGTPVQGSYSPYALSGPYSAATNSGSIFFNYGADYLTIPASSSLSFGTGDFTIEFWMRSTQTATSANLIKMTSSWAILVYSNSNIYWQNVEGGSSLFNASYGSLMNGSWHHVAAVRASNAFKLYIDGAVVLSGTDSTNYTTVNPVLVGYGTYGYFNGHISNLRVVKGTALYSGSSFTPPTTAVTAISGTSLLLNGTNSAVFDQTAKNNLSTGSSFGLSTTQSKFGGSSMYFDGTANTCVFAAPSTTTLSPINNPGAFGTGDFTVECWVYVTASGGYQCFMTNRNSAGGAGTWFLGLYTGTTQVVWLNGGSVLLSSAALTTGAWHHVAACRSSGTTKLFIDGAVTGTPSASDTTNYSVGVMSIGYDIVEAGYGFTGYIDEVRVTRYARYTTTFTPSTSAFPNQ